MRPKKDGSFSTQAVASFDELIGNTEPFDDAIEVLRWDGAPPRFCLLGPSGSGKSTQVNCAIRVAICQMPEGRRPCWKCDRCIAYKTGRTEVGLFVEHLEKKGVTPVHYLPINCRNVTAKYLHDQIERLRGQDGLRIIHLEEAAELRKSNCDLSLTDLMDHVDFHDVRWFMTAVRNRELDEQFRRRWDIKLTTSRPPDFEVAKLLARRCHEKQIEVEAPELLLEVARRSWGVIGFAATVLGQALVKKPRKLTKAMVEGYPFPTSDPWAEQYYAS